jgi:hypothetical protein
METGQLFANRILVVDVPEHAAREDWREIRTTGAGKSHHGRANRRKAVSSLAMSSNDWFPKL